MYAIDDWAATRRWLESALSVPYARDFMSSHGSVSNWIAALKEGDSAAAQPLWERYYRQLVVLARKKLGAAARRDADEEDVVQNAFHSFFRAAGQGRFPQLDDRDSLWRSEERRVGKESMSR